MIIDTSALVAILAGELDREIFRHAIALDDRPTIGAPTLVELTTVIDRRRISGLSAEVDAQLTALGVHVAPFTAEHAIAARTAYARFGRGSGHRAKLNLGDVFSYAMAVVGDEPLLFKGEDFTYTDVRDALKELGDA
jgi:ribonuclease VapC